MTTGLTQAELFDVFSNARRRLAVQFLIFQNGSSDLAPLVEQIAAWENGIDTDEVTRTQRRRVYISLYQTHLPMLEDHGIVDWDPDTHTITLVADEDRFAPYLDQGGGADRSWHQLYAAVTATGFIAYLVAWLSVGPLTLAVTPQIALALCGAILLVAAGHTLSRRASLPLPSVFQVTR